ncbi:MAG: homoserine kinase [Eubacteriales bacterium]
MYKIKVPATTANIGPGFDSFGMALRMYNHFYIDYCQDLVIEGTHSNDWNNNLVYTSAMKVFKHYHQNDNFTKGLYLRFQTAIPQSRGLGSSATCVVGGVIGANLLLGQPYTKDELFKIAVSIEGHPDNIAPALYGGLNISTLHGNQLLRKNIPVSPVFNYYVLIPNFEFSTQNARSLLPEKVDFTDAVGNISSAVLLILSLMEGDGELLKSISPDTLHEPYRKKLIEDYDKIKGFAIKNGAFGCFLSGAGPSLLCITPQNIKFLNTMENDIQLLNHTWSIHELGIDHHGATYTEE